MMAEFMILWMLNNPTFTKDVKPIIQKRCTPCHTGQMSLPNFLDYKTAFKYRYFIKSRVMFKNMPPGNSTNMTEKERDIIIRWVEGEANE